MSIGGGQGSDQTAKLWGLMGREQYDMHPTITTFIVRAIMKNTKKGGGDGKV